jgi:septal ring factor EnvC (AmiA/AmiB activator)
MNAVYTSVGQTVLAGEPVGQMGDKKADLYVEIRQNGQAMDPEPWFVK